MLVPGVPVYREAPRARDQVSSAPRSPHAAPRRTTASRAAVCVCVRVRARAPCLNNCVTCNRHARTPHVSSMYAGVLTWMSAGAALVECRRGRL
eukprot:1180428-Rhodomonas_salina.1